MKKILVTYNIPKDFTRKYINEYEFIFPENDFFSKEEIINNIKDCEILLSIFSLPVDKEIIDAGEKLEIISNYGVGYNNIDIEYAKKNNIRVCNTPESVCYPTAELSIGLMLSLSRRIAECNHKLRVDNNFKWGVMENLGSSLRGKTLGIVGCGKIGKEVAKLAQCFGMNIIYTKRNKLEDSIEKEYNMEYHSFNSLITNSDIISIHTPLNKDTKYIISKKEFSKMKTNALIINTARGGVINEEDLIEAINTKTISGAALDVFENEPNINPALKTLDNVIIVPHIGTASIDARIEMGNEAMENINQYFRKSPQNIIV
ncbi:dihydrofolate reductase [Marinilabiliaceae bacterium JC040]|nr:dihydrofolate reductase [Marinilabiliaceae bacterium JC040]